MAAARQSRSTKQTINSQRLKRSMKTCKTPRDRLCFLIFTFTASSLSLSLVRSSYIVSRVSPRSQPREGGIKQNAFADFTHDEKGRPSVRDNQHCCCLWRDLHVGQYTGISTNFRHLRFVGPGLVSAVAYIDPGNWATDLEAGARFGYKLLFVVLLAGLAAVGEHLLDPLPPTQSAFGSRLSARSAAPMQPWYINRH